MPGTVDIVALAALGVFVVALIVLFMTALFNRKVLAAVLASRLEHGAQLEGVHKQTVAIELQGNSRWDAAMKKIEELQQEVRRLIMQKEQAENK